MVENENHELGSAVIGKAQGFYLPSSLDGTRPGTGQTLSLTVLLDREHDHHDTLDDAINFSKYKKVTCTTRKHAIFRRTFRRTTKSSDAFDDFPTAFRRKQKILLRRKFVGIYRRLFDQKVCVDSTSNLSAVEDLADVELVENFTKFGLDAVVHSEDEAEVGEFDEDSDDSD
ncbi:hypothetical protein YC2023_048919 [Brassica napus]